MGAQDKNVLLDFQTESKVIVARLTEILEQCEGRPEQVKRLEEYGLNVDRIMGAARSIAGMAQPSEAKAIQQLGDYAAICKAVGYKASQIRENPAFYDISVALLQDATDVLRDLVENMFAGDRRNIKEVLSAAFIDRLKWISNQFGANFKATVELPSSKNKMNQGEIDELLKKLGLD